MAGAACALQWMLQIATLPDVSRDGLASLEDPQTTVPPFPHTGQTNEMISPGGGRLLSGEEVHGGRTSTTTGNRVLWRPFVGTPGEILKQHPDPLRALSRGKVPAIVLKQQINAAELASLREHLFKLHAAGRVWTKKGASDTGGYIGIAFTSALKWNLSPKKYATLASTADAVFRKHNIFSPIAALYNGLRALAVGRTVRTARDVHTNRSFTSATFRMQPNGTAQPIHIDSLHAFERLACRRRCGCGPASAPRRDKQQTRLSAYDDMRRFTKQFSALVLLQRSDMPSPEVSVYGHHVDDLEADCGLNIVGQKGKRYPGPTNAFPANFEPTASTRRSFHAHSNDIGTGDVYIFNSNYLHEVHPIIVHEQTRMSISTFVGYSDDEIVVWG